MKFVLWHHIGILALLLFNSINTDCIMVVKESEISSNTYT